MAARKKKLTLGQLRDLFMEFLAFQEGLGLTKPLTVQYYRHQLGRFVESTGVDKVAGELTRIEIQQHARTWHRIQAVQRLCHWGCDQEPPLLDRNPAKKVPKPRLGQRTRVLTGKEEVLVRRRARRPLRDFLLCAQQTMARPGEIRSFTWEHIREDGKAFELTEFKAKARMGGEAAIRVIPITRRLSRLLERLRRRFAALGEFAGPVTGAIFLNDDGEPWSKDALSCSMKRLRRRMGLHSVCAYTLRHTAATVAVENGYDVYLLSQTMGHRNVKTTQRYVHLRSKQIVDGIEQATKKQRSPKRKPKDQADPSQ